ncbi:hypothetical protein vseg_003002 [Gypsophila vaccaria]
MNHSSKTYSSSRLLLCTLILALVATLIMTTNPVAEARSLTRHSNRNNNKFHPKYINRKNTHGRHRRPRKLDEDSHSYPPQDYGLQPNPFGPGNYYSGGGGYNYPGGGYGYYPGDGGYYGGGGYSTPLTDVKP